MNRYFKETKYQNLLLCNNVGCSVAFRLAAPHFAGLFISANVLRNEGRCDIIRSENRMQKEILQL